MFADFGTQLEGFVIYADSDTGPPIYSNVGVDYGVGMFEIVLEPEVLASSFIVQRPAGGYITICEFEAYEGKETDFNWLIVNVKLVLFSSFQTISYNIQVCAFSVFDWLQFGAFEK